MLFRSPATHRRSLVVPETPQPGAQGGLDLNAMTGFVTAIAGLVHGHSAPATPVTPSKPAAAIQGAPSVHSIPPSPSDLHRCLTYIAQHPQYGLPNAEQYEEGLKKEGYGPDIIPQLDQCDLIVTPVKLKKGDAFRLKRACEAWWNAPDGKRLRNEPIPALDVGSSSKAGTDANTVRYERRWFNPDGSSNGAKSWFAPPMVRNDMPGTPPDPEHDGKVFYFDEARGGEWVEVPDNYTIPEAVLDWDM